MEKILLTEGAALLQRPIMPLVSMVQFLFMTGPFTLVSEVIDELPEPIETDRTVYAQPRQLLLEYLDILAGLEALKAGIAQGPAVVDAEGNPVDESTAVAAVIHQQVLERELERINSLLCEPCGCKVCCVGPDESMEQEFFEIPLAQEELDLFQLARVDSGDSRARLANDPEELCLDGQPFYRLSDPVLIRWSSGWSLILPQSSICPNLEERGGCRVYPDRPGVCRKPQIFPYMVEPVQVAGAETPVMRIRQSLLAVVDCPYVRELKQEIADYAAASELHLVLKQNKR